jgi:Spy/CpxP family protein refolding chaperone
MSLKHTVLAISITAGLASSAAALAQPAGGRWAGGGGLGEALHAVQLSSAQQQQIHQIMSAARAQNAPQLAQMKALQQQMTTTLLSSGSVTEAQLLPLEQQQESIRSQLDLSRMQTAMAIRNVLTSAQLTQAASAQAQLSALHAQEHAIVAPTGE